MAIKMRVNNAKDSECNECGCPYNSTGEMYDLVLCGVQFTLCKECIDTLFTKTLRANCMYNGKLKRPEDLKRAERAKMRKDGKLYETKNKNR